MYKHQQSSGDAGGAFADAISGVADWFRSKPDASLGGGGGSGGGGDKALGGPPATGSGSGSSSGGGAISDNEAELAEKARKEAEQERARRSRQLRRQMVADSLPNPGKFDEIGREILDVFATNCFEGVRFEYHKPLCMARDKSFSYSHLLWMGPQQFKECGHYEFGINLGFEKAMLMGQLDANGALNGRYHHQWLPSLQTKLSFSVMPEAKRHFNSAVLEADYTGEDTSIGAKLTHEGLAIGSYFQSVTPTIALGVEGMYHPVEHAIHSRFAAKYDNRKDMVCANVFDNGSVALNYGHRVSERLTLGSEFKFDPASHESQVAVGYKWTLRQAQFKASIDSNGVVSGALEEMITPALKLTLTGEVAHATNQYKFGVAATIG